MPHIVALAERYGVQAKIRRAKPSGRATDNRMIMTHPTPEYFAMVDYLNKHTGKVDIEDIMNKDPNYKKDVLVSSNDCGAGGRSMHVDQLGNVSPCIFLGPQYTAGNIFKGHRIIDLWRTSHQFHSARTIALHEDCGGCQREQICHNECPAIKMYATGSYSGKDPSCLRIEPTMRPVVLLDKGSLRKLPMVD